MISSAVIAYQDSQRPTHSVKALKCSVRSAIPGLGRGHQVLKLHVNNFVPHRIEYQLSDRMKLELSQDIASMCFYRFKSDIQDRGYIFGTPALSHELHDLALPRRQFAFGGHGWTKPMSIVSACHQVGHS